MSRGPFLKTRAGRVSLLAMLVLDIFIVGATCAFVYEAMNVPVLIARFANPTRSGQEGAR